jgi:hypothetical protein
MEMAAGRRDSSGEASVGKIAATPIHSSITPGSFEPKAIAATSDEFEAARKVPPMPAVPRWYVKSAPGEPDGVSTGHHAMIRIRLIPPTSDPYAPNVGRLVPMPRDLADHRPILPYHDGGDFGDELDEVHCAAAMLIQDPMRDVAVAMRALTYEQQRQVATALRTTVMRLNTWASLMLEAWP